MLKKKGWSIETIILLLPAVLFLATVFIYPFIYALNLSLTAATGEYTVANYINFFTEDRWEYHSHFPASNDFNHRFSNSHRLLYARGDKA